MTKIKTVTVKLRLPKTRTHLLCLFGCHLWVNSGIVPRCVYCGKDIFLAEQPRFK